VNYKHTILNAVEEVDDAIANYAAGQDSLTRLNNALTDSQQAVSLASQRYDRGLTDFLNVLDAERQMYALQQEYATTQETAVIQYIAVYKGLGGGWENYQSVPSVHQPMPAIIATVQRVVFADNPDK
jgi:outer membrane protein TolC